MSLFRFLIEILIGIFSVLLVVGLFVSLFLAKLFAIGFVIYFFLAAGGVVPPLNYIPFIPFI